MSHVLNGFPCSLKTGRLTRAGFGGARLRVARDHPLLLAASAESADAGSLQRRSVVASFAGTHGSREGREVGSDLEAPLSPSPLYPLQPKTGGRFYLKLGFSKFGTHASSLLGPGHEGTCSAVHAAGGTSGSHRADPGGWVQLTALPGGRWWAPLCWRPHTGISEVEGHPLRCCFSRAGVCHWRRRVGGHQCHSSSHSLFEEYWDEFPCGSVG